MSADASPSIREVDAAIAALEAQRGTLGDAVVDTALGPLRERRSALLAADAGERRTLVSVLFADLVGFTVLSRRLDAEDTREVVNACFARWQRVIDEHDGVVEKYIGDAVMAVFGLHRSREDDAARAVRAARAMVVALADLADETERRFGVRLQMRVGVDTGDVVVSTLGERPGHDFVAVGPTVNRASRLQGEAPVDGVLISEETRRQVRGIFGLEARAGLRLKGIEEPVDAWVALAERAHGFELEPATGVGGVETTTVGRAIELLALQEHLADVVADSSWRITTVVGDAGVGKSRLLLDLDHWLAERSEPCWWLRGRAAPSSQSRPHALLRDVVCTRFRIVASDSPATVLARCEEGFEAAFGASARTRRDALVVASWLGFAVTGDPAERGDAVPRNPQELRREASDLLARYLAELARHAPVVVLLEDLHWADDASLHWLDDADHVLSEVPVLVVATARPALLEARPHWGEGLEHHARVPLEPLSRRESRLLLDQLLRKVEHVPRQLADLVAEGAEGNPFYIEELVTWLVDAGVVVRGEDTWTVRLDQIDRVRVPSTLRGVLQSRIDSLEATERSVLQRASVVGRVFWDDAVSVLSDGVGVGETLDRLRGRDVVHQRATSAFDSAREFLFKHALLRDVAYEGMLRAHRRGYHSVVAAWLAEVTQAHGRAEEFAAVVAEHADLAGDAGAASWYLRAGRRAASVYATEEADRLLARGLAVADDTAHDLRFDLLAEHVAVADRRGERDLQRADLEAMAPLVDLVEPERRVRHHLARARFAFDTSAYDDAALWAAAAVALGEAEGQVEAATAGHLWAGKALTWTADAADARTALGAALDLAGEHGLRLAEAEAWRYLAMLAGNEGDYPQALDLAERSRARFAAEADAEGEGTALVQLATTSFQLGRLGEARAFLESARPVFARSGHRYREAIVLGNLATIASGQGELGRALGWVRDAVALTTRLQDVEALATNLVILSEVELALGRLDDAREHALAGLEAAAGVSLSNIDATALCVLASAASEEGDHEEALSRARAAVAVGEASPSSREAGLAQLATGHVLAATGDEAGAYQAFVRAREILDRLGVQGFALEAHAALALGLLRQDRTAEALDVVELVLPHLDGEEVDAAWRPELADLACVEVLGALGDERAPAARVAARARLHRRAARVGDDDLVAHYLARPFAAALLAATDPGAPGWIDDSGRGDPPDL